MKGCCALLLAALAACANMAEGKAVILLRYDDMPEFMQKTVSSPIDIDVQVFEVADKSKFDALSDYELLQVGSSSVGTNLRRYSKAAYTRAIEPHSALKIRLSVPQGAYYAGILIHFDNQYGTLCRTIVPIARRRTMWASIFETERSEAVEEVE